MIATLAQIGFILRYRTRVQADVVAETYKQCCKRSILHVAISASASLQDALNAVRWVQGTRGSPEVDINVFVRNKIEMSSLKLAEIPKGATTVVATAEQIQ
eukprot:gene16797-19955_t